MKFHSFAYDCPVFPMQFIEEILLSPLHVPGSFVLTDYKCVGLFLGFLSYVIDCFYANTILFRHYNLVFCFEVVCVLLLALFFFLKIALLMIFCFSIQTLELIFLYQLKMPLEFWDELNWICRILWIEWAFWQY